MLNPGTMMEGDRAAHIHCNMYR